MEEGFLRLIVVDQAVDQEIARMHVKHAPDLNLDALIIFQGVVHGSQGRVPDDRET